MEDRTDVTSPYMTTEDVMTYYHVTRRTVYRWVSEGRLTPKRAGRRLMFERDEVKRLIEGE